MKEEPNRLYDEFDLDFLEPDECLRTIAEIQEELALRAERAAARRSFLYYAKRVKPDLIQGRHMRVMAKVIERQDLGWKGYKRVLFILPPGHTKSECTSIMLPAWKIGKYGRQRVLHISHTDDLVRDFGRQVKDLIQAEEYQTLFPGVSLRSDSKAAGKWITTSGGEYRAHGVGSAIAGKRGEIGIGDDLMSEQDAYSERAQDRIKTWWAPGFLTRMMPKAPIFLCMTRWTKKDPASWLIAKNEELRPEDRYKVVDLPAILDEAAVKLLAEFGEEAKVGEALFEELWGIEVLRSLESNFTVRWWNALYMRNPTEEEGTILLRGSWKTWPSTEKIPRMEFVLDVWDTAYEEKEETDYNAMTSWGIFVDPFRSNRRSLMMLGAWRGKLAFPKLKRKSQELTLLHRADLVLIEPKASGKSLKQELALAGLPVREWQPERDRRGSELSKYARAHAASVLLDEGGVYVPDRRWAEEVVDECAEFPNGEYKDWVDTCTMAWLWFRRRWQVDTDSEAPGAGHETLDMPQDDEDAGDEVAAARERKRRKAAYG